MNLNIVYDIKEKKDIVPVFNTLINNVVNDKELMDEAKKYNEYCEVAYKDILTERLMTVKTRLELCGLKVIVQSSFSADVYLAIPGDLDIDIVIPYDDGHEFDTIGNVLINNGFTFKEIRNGGMIKYAHWVYVMDCGDFIVEAKVRYWNTYKEHLYKIHKYLDETPKETRIAWRYIRSKVMDCNDEIKKKIKYLWYMYGAINTNVACDSNSFPMNIYY